MTKNEAAVVVVGAGSTGLTLAAELALAGVEVLLLERRPTAALAGSRAGGLHARTIELFDQRGIAERFLTIGKTMQVAGFGLIPLDISDFPTRHPYGLALWQNHIERVLATWVENLSVKVERDVEVTGFVDDGGGVSVSLADGRTIRARYLVGCDGGHSIVRKTAGIDFPGWDATVSHLLAEVEVAQEPPWGMRVDAQGTSGFSKLEHGSLVRVMVTEAAPGAPESPTLGELSARLKTLYGSDFGIHSPVWLTRFTDAARQAAVYRKGNVLLAGDAAHIHYPAGGQGLNIGVHDAMNLGWKLAQVVRGSAPETLLDTYQAERHPVAAKVLRLTLAQVAMRRTDERSLALNETIAELLKVDAARKTYGGLMSGLSLRYELGGSHALVGRRMPDLDLLTAEGPRRLYSLLHRARPVLLSFVPGATLPDFPTGERHHATAASAWELPVIGTIEAPPAVLIRPDGYVAWAGDPGDSRLQEAMSRWF